MSREPVPCPALSGPADPAGRLHSGRLDGQVHVFPVRVYYEDTDAAGIVYYANYLKFVERARTELMRMLGAEHARLLAGEGVAWAVRRCLADYLVPAILDDALEVHTRILAIGAARLDAEQVVRRDGRDLARVEVRLACIDRRGRAVRLPAAIRAALVPLAQHSQRRGAA